MDGSSWVVIRTEWGGQSEMRRSEISRRHQFGTGNRKTLEGVVRASLTCCRRIARSRAIEGITDMTLFYDAAAAVEASIKYKRGQPNLSLSRMIYVPPVPVFSRAIVR